MKVTTLIENQVNDCGLVAEHGLSFYLADNDKKILFDVGQSSKFTWNAKRMGISIEDIDILIISHGHYDHTGGIEQFLQLNSKAKIYLKREALYEKFSKGKYVGIPKSLHIPNDRIKFVRKETKISDNIHIITKIDNHFDIDLHKVNFTFKEEGIFCADEFNDELFLVIEKSSGLTIISSCSHNGITNIAETAKNIFKKPIERIIGGFHTKNDKNAIATNHMIKYFNDKKISEIYTCHCTGVENYSLLKQHCTSKVLYNSTGNQINI